MPAAQRVQSGVDMIVEATDSRLAGSGPSQERFATVLRERTQTVHREAERAGFIADLLRGRANRRGYASYLANLLVVYETMERLLDSEAACPVQRAFADPRLARADALRRDIRALAEDDLDTVAVLPEARDYAAAVERAGGGLVGHAYARYLGDLSGGQILKSLLERSLGLSRDHLHFYDFSGMDIADGKTALRQALDTVDVATPDAARIVAEATVSFRHTIALSCAISAARAT